MKTATIVILTLLIVFVLCISYTFYKNTSNAKNTCNHNKLQIESYEAETKDGFMAYNYYKVPINIYVVHPGTSIEILVAKNI